MCPCYFTAKEAEAQRDQVTCPGSHRQKARREPHNWAGWLPDPTVPLPPCSVGDHQQLRGIWPLGAGKALGWELGPIKELTTSRGSTASITDGGGL